MPNPVWIRDELILALDFYVRYKNLITKVDSPEFKELLRHIHLLNKRLGRFGDSRFRNAPGVKFHLAFFLRFDDTDARQGVKGGSDQAEVVWDTYAGRHDELKRIAEAIRSYSTSNQEIVLESLRNRTEPQEGYLLTAAHKSIEKRHLAILKRDDSGLTCEACEFDFNRVYGDIGRGFIDCHHTKPLDEYSADQLPDPKDFALICSNCHSMIHRPYPWLRLEHLKNAMNKAASQLENFDRP